MMGGYGNYPRRDWRTELVVWALFVALVVFVLWLALGVR